MSRADHSSFVPGQPQNRDKPIKVRGGVRLRRRADEAPSNWAGQRWMRMVESCAPGDRLAEGLEYARAGQTRAIDVHEAQIAARVQGRRPRAYALTIDLDRFTHEHWEQVASAMVDQAGYGAKLLAGELPASIEDVFAPLGVSLFPRDPSEIHLRCACDDEHPWCKHACCAAALVAERMEAEPFLIFALRGMHIEEVLERLRRRWSAAAGPGGASAAYTPHPPEGVEALSAPLEALVDSFWEPRPGLHELDTSPRPVEVRHPLLRRLGPSPFGSGRGFFPLIGLLATCYDVASDAARREDDAETEIDTRTESDASDDQPLD